MTFSHFKLTLQQMYSPRTHLLSFLVTLCVTYASPESKQCFIYVED